MTDFIQFSREAAEKGDVFAAYRLLVAAVAAEPGDARAWYELGARLAEFKKYPAAIGAFARADMLRPGHHETLTNLGLHLGLVGRFGEARRVLGRAIEADPVKANGWLQQAQVLYAVGAPSSASARQAVHLAPDWSLAHMQLAFSLLTEGHWLEGFSEYEWRFHYKAGMSEFLTYPYPLWRGEKTGTLVLVAEQGLGDSIMMMRYVLQVAAQSSVERMIWLCHKEMLGLAEMISSSEIEVIPMPAPLPAGDAFCPMMSLPVALKDDTIDWPGVYISEPALANAGGRLCAKAWEPDHLRVGIDWAGDPLHENAQHRDIPLDALLPLAEIPGITLYGLEVGGGQVQIDMLGAHALVGDLSGRISSLVETARAIAGLDLVISVDTVTAHLAGAMGKPVWLIVNQRARDWRWGRSGKSTPWYPSMRIFARQLDELNWDAVVGRVGAALRERVADSGMPF